MFGLSGGELILIGIIALIFLGPQKLPEFAKSLGKAFNEFQKAKAEITNSPLATEQPLRPNVLQQVSAKDLKPVNPEVVSSTFLTQNSNKGS